MKEAKESFRILIISLVRRSITKFERVSYQSNSKRSFGYTNTGACVKFCSSHPLKFQDCK